MGWVTAGGGRGAASYGGDERRRSVEVREGRLTEAGLAAVVGGSMGG